MNEIPLTWLQVKSWAEDEIEKLRKRNDSVETPAHETQAIRGEIRALKRLLGLPAEAARAKAPSTPAWPGDE